MHAQVIQTGRGRSGWRGRWGRGLWVWLAGCLVWGAACAGEGVTLREESGGWRVLGGAYEAVIAGDGCLSSLRGAGEEFLDSKAGISRGGYLWIENKPTGYGTIRKDSEASLRAESPAATITYRCAPDALALTIQNKTDAGLTQVFVLDAGVEGLAENSKTFRKFVFNGNLASGRLLKKTATLEITQPCKAFGPFMSTRQVLTFMVPARGELTLQLATAAVTAEEAGQLKADLAPAPAAAGGAAPEQAPPPAGRVEIEPRYLTQIPASEPTELAPAEGVRAILFAGPEYQGKPSRVFAYVGVPAGKPGEKFPAVVCLHGGGGTAQAEWVRVWNRHGYAAIALDLCGRYPVKNAAAKGWIDQWTKLPDGGGPDGWEASFGQVRAPLRDQWVYYAVNAAARAATLLGSLPEVDPERIGLTGVSWGGFLTGIVMGLDARYRFAVPVYGCGAMAINPRWGANLETPDGKIWLAQFEPLLYLPGTKARVLWMSSANDFAYPLNSLQKSYQALTAPVTLRVMPDMPHGHEYGWNPEEVYAFADSVCRGGKPLLQISAERAEAGGAASVAYAGPDALKKAELCYTLDRGDWMKRKWRTSEIPFDPAEAKNGVYRGVIKAAIPAGATAYFFNLTDTRGLLTSSRHWSNADAPGSGSATASTAAAPAAVPAALSAIVPGTMIARTMQKLQQSTAQHPAVVDILFYGQSITAQEWSGAVGDELKKRYPTAKLTVRNRAIGGFEAPTLIRVAEHDVFPQYPDLIVFHVYGGHRSGELEALVRDFRTRTTAEIMLATHHVRATPANAQQEQTIAQIDDGGSEVMRQLAAKYGCELVDIRPQWQAYLKQNALQPEALLKDGIHLNQKGNQLMAALQLRHFTCVAGEPNRWSQSIRIVPAPAVKDGKLELQFVGNRIDVLLERAPTADMAADTITIDGQSPSQLSRLQYFTRPNNIPGTWWPGILRISSQTPSAEDWTLTITGGDAASNRWDFTLTGSVTGADGAGNTKADFVSPSRKVMIQSGDWRLAMVKPVVREDVPAGTVFRWSSRANGADNLFAVNAIAANPATYTIASGLDNGKHTLVIALKDAAAIKGFAIHQPPLQ